MNALSRFFSGLGERDRRALQLLAAAASLILLVRFVVYPMLDAAEDFSGSIPVREKTLRKHRALAEATPARESGFGALKARREQAEAGLLKSQTAPLAAAEVQQQVREMATAAGIQVRSVDFLPLRKMDAAYVAVPVSAQFSAPVEQLVSLLNALQIAQATLAVEQLRVSAVNNKQVNVYLVVSGAATAEIQKAENSRQ